MLVHCIILLVIGSSTYLNAVLLCQNTKTILDTDWLLVMGMIWGAWKKYMHQQIIEEDLNLKYHVNIYQDVNDSFMM